MEKYSVQPLDLMQFINTKYHEPFIHARIEMDKAPDSGRLAEALDGLLRAFPLLRCRYDERENAFIPIDGLTGRDLLRVADGVGRDELLTESLDMEKEMFRLTVSGNTLYITVSHLVCDGGGFKQLVYLLCDSYNGGLDGDRGYLMDRDFSRLTRDLPGRMGTLSMLLSMLGKYENRPVYAKGEGERPYAVEAAITKEAMDRAHRAAKARGATLNDVFLTAYARTLARLYGLGKLCIPCTVDLRKYAKGQTGIGNLTGTYNLNIKIKADESFGETLAAVSARMRGQKSTRNDIAGPALLVSKYEKSSLESFLKLYGNMDTSEYTDYTNLGVWDETRLAFAGAAVKTAVGYSGMSKAPCFQLAISTFRGETVISSLFRCSESEKEKAARVISGVAAEISSFAP